MSGAETLMTLGPNIRRWRLPMPNQYTKHPITPDERFWAKVDKNGPVPENRPDLGPCWLWLGAQQNDGYAQIEINDRKVMVHHFLLSSAPKGYQWDHLCRVRHCVNPSHLEIVTPQVNTLRGTSPTAQNARKTYCPNGHPFDLFNTYFDKRGSRHCRACMKERTRP